MTKKKASVKRWLRNVWTLHMVLFIKAYWLYLTLFLAFCAIVYFGRFLPIDSKRFAALIGLGSGGVASVIVAGLLAMHDNHKTKRRKEILERILIDEFVHSLVAYIEYFCMSCCVFDPPLRSEQKSFLEWNEFYVDMAKKYDAEEEHAYSTPIDREQLKECIDKVKKAFSEVESEKIDHYEKGIITSDQLEIMKNISYSIFLFSLSYKEENTPNSVFVHNVSINNHQLNQLLLDDSRYEFLAKQPFSFDMRLSRYISDLPKI